MQFLVTPFRPVASAAGFASCVQLPTATAHFEVVKARPLPPPAPGPLRGTPHADAARHRAQHRAQCRAACMSKANF